MAQAINYVKMHGLGNDFVIIQEEALHKDINLPKLAKTICDRRLGIGADQFVIYKAQDSYYDMLIYNQDGSKASICGNAARCLAKLINIQTGADIIYLRIPDRTLECIVINDSTISINMGKVSFNESWMLDGQKLREFTARYSIDSKEIICVEASNPHIVIFSSLPGQDQEIIGKKLQDKEFFLDGINVSFANIKDNTISLKVWERGVGFTLACGSGACASFAAANKLGYVETNAIVEFELGSLAMSMEGENIIMVGPASLVAKGEYYYE